MGTDSPTDAHNESDAEVKTRESLEAEKVRLEICALRREATRSHRMFANVVPLSFSLVTAIVAIISVLTSIQTQRQAASDTVEARRYQSIHDQKTAHDVSLQEALSMATDPSGGADRRLAGIYQLDQFWQNESDQPVVAATLVALLSIPDSFPGSDMIRCAAGREIGDAYARLARQTTNPDGPTIVPLRELLFGNIQKVGLIGPQISPAPRIPSARASKRTVMGPGPLKGCTPEAATRRVLVRSIRNLRYVNFSGLDLSGLSFAGADLRGAHLNRADLTDIDFSCANLSDLDASPFEFLKSSARLANLGESELAKAYYFFGDAINISDADWQHWRSSQFRSEVLKQILLRKEPNIKRNFEYCSQLK
jgi:hypothetical protein